jgi:hypothetical protein
MNTATINLFKDLVSAAFAVVFTAVLAGSINNSVGPLDAGRPLIQAVVQIDTTVVADRTA